MCRSLAKGGWGDNMKYKSKPGGVALTKKIVAMLQLHEKLAAGFFYLVSSSEKTTLRNLCDIGFSKYV